MKIGWRTSRRALKAVLVGLLMTQSMSFARADGRVIREALDARADPAGNTGE
jgi:hypothetical protein